MAANPILIITAVIFAILIFIASVYFLVYFQHPEDKLVAWFPKIIVVSRVSSVQGCYSRVYRFLDYLLQRTISFCYLLMSPYRALVRLLGSAGFLISVALYSEDARAMTLVSYVLYITATILILVFVPFCILWYEGYDGDDDEEGGKRLPLFTSFKPTITLQRICRSNELYVQVAHPPAHCGWNSLWDPVLADRLRWCPRGSANWHICPEK